MLDKNEIIGLVRAVIQILCGVLISRGLIESSDVEPLIGLGIAAVTAWFSIRAKRKVKDQAATALEQKCGP